MLYNKFLEQVNDGYMIRVRLQPNSSSCQIKDILLIDDEYYLKITVCSVPEKGKANNELISFLSKKLKLSKSSFVIISGELDRYKKILIKTDNKEIIAKFENLLLEEKK